MGRGNQSFSITKRSRSMPLEPGQLWGWERLDRLSPQRRQIDLGIRLPLMLGLTRILSLIPMGRGNITPTQFQGTLNFITGTLTILYHGKILAYPSDNWKKFQGKFLIVVT